MTLTETVRAQTRQAVAELLAAARMRAGDIFIIGCSSSEVVGQRIGCGSSTVSYTHLDVYKRQVPV